MNTVNHQSTPVVTRATSPNDFVELDDTLSDLEYKSNR